MQPRSPAALSLFTACALTALHACSSSSDTQTSFSRQTTTPETTSGGAQVSSGATAVTTANTNTEAAGAGDSTAVGLAAASGPPAAGSVAAGPVLGGDADHPVPRCGPRDSYYFVSTEFRCPDGSNPLNGSLVAGQRSRRGNVGANNTTGNIIDLYEVPCATGPERVYVDMYHCPPGVNPLFGP